MELSDELNETLSRSSAAASTIQTGWRKHKTRKRPLRVPIVRRPSFTITNQGTFRNCWNHTLSRILCRFMFNILDLSYEDSLECDRLYSLKPYSDGNEKDTKLLIENARAFCQGTGYIKFLLYTFFNRFFNENFGCIGAQATQKHVLQYASPLFDTKETFHDSIEDFLQADKHRVLNVVFGETLYPLFLAFFKKKQRGSWNVKYLSETFYTRRPEMIEEILDKGLYISIFMFLGDGLFNNSFNAYRKGRELYIFDSRVFGSVVEKNSHVMTIVGYTNVISRDKTKKFILLHIKNSWGRKWGIDGMFYYYLHNLAAFHTVFTWVEPSNLDVLTFRTTPMTISEDEFQRDYVLKYREKNEELLEAMENKEYNKFIPLIDAGADINILDERLNTPLGIAIQANNIDLCKELLLRDANVNEPILGTTTPFLLVLINNQTEILRYILIFATNLNAKVYIDAITYLCDTYEIDGNEERLNTMRILFDHIRYEEDVLYSLFKDPIPENDILFNFIKEGNDKLIQFLLEYGTDPNFQRPHYKKHILKAKILGLDSIVQILRHAGAIEDPSQENKELANSLRHFSSLFTYSSKKNQTLADTRAFLDGLRSTKPPETIKDILNDEDAVLLCSSINEEDERFLQLLLEYGADPNFYNKKIHKTCIQIAQENGLDRIVQILRDKILQDAQDAAGALEDIPSPAGGKRHYYRVTRKRRKRITRNRKRKARITRHKQYYNLKN